jgi:hypothetical protein
MADIEIIKVKMDSVEATFISANQGQGSRA